MCTKVAQNPIHFISLAATVPQECICHGMAFGIASANSGNCLFPSKQLLLFAFARTGIVPCLPEVSVYGSPSCTRWHTVPVRNDTRHSSSIHACSRTGSSNFHISHEKLDQNGRGLKSESVKGVVLCGCKNMTVHVYNNCIRLYDVVESDGELIVMRRRRNRCQGVLIYNVNAQNCSKVGIIKYIFYTNTGYCLSKYYLLKT